MPQPISLPLGSLSGVADRFVADLAEEAGELHMPPFAVVADHGGEIRQRFVTLDVRREVFVDQADIAGIDVVVGIFERDRRVPAVSFEEGESQLRVPDEDHPRRPPVVVTFGKRSASMNRVLVWPARNGPQLA